MINFISLFEMVPYYLEYHDLMNEITPFNARFHFIISYVFIVFNSCMPRNYLIGCEIERNQILALNGYVEEFYCVCKPCETGFI
jgi:hypothetical protein